MTKNPKGFAPVLVLIILGFIGIVGYLVIKQLGVQPTPTTSQLPSPFPTSTPDETANWKTYTNSDYGFEISYPLDWQVKQEYLDSSFKSDVFPGKTKYFVELIDPSKSTSIMILPEGEIDAGLEDTTEGTTQIGGKTVKTYTYTNGLVLFVDFELPKLQYFKIHTKPRNRLVDQILSTFKLLDNTNAEGKYCGGFAPHFCPEGYTCKVPGNVPDGDGICVKN